MKLTTISAFAGFTLLISSGIALAAARDSTEPGELLQKHLLAETVSKTEKQKILGVDITAPGLAVVRYGGTPIRKVYITFTFDNMLGASDAKTMTNPVGFRVLSYTPASR